jgi:putative tryptophan/tyrosine transport system substrate-binding protein
VRRREFIKIVSAGAAWPFAVRAEQVDRTRTRRIGILTGFRENDPESRARIGAFMNELGRLGWAEGKNIEVNARFAGDAPERMVSFAQQLVEASPDVIVVQSAPGVTAVTGVTRSIPTVFLQLAVDDVLIIGLKHSRPGSNLTGFTNFEFSMAGKWVELLKEIAPHTERVLVIIHVDGMGGHKGYIDAAEGAGKKLGMHVQARSLTQASELEPAIRELTNIPNSGLILTPSNLTAVNRKAIFAVANELKLPTVSAFRYMAASGSLISYGIDLLDMFKRAAGYVDRIFGGEAPGNLPIQLPEKFELVINKTTANLLGLVIPPQLIVRADEVIE